MSGPECTCSEDHVRRTGRAFHEEGCPVLAAQVAEFQERRAREEAAKEARKATPAPQPKSRSRGRIVDQESARRELLSMANTAKGDPRLSPCAAYVYGMLNARGYKHGSVFVAASPNRLSELSGDTFSQKQCERALERLQLLGYIEKVKWSRVSQKRGGDPGLYRWAQRLGRPGRWPNPYLLKQDLPEREVVPDEENPVLEMFDLAPA